MNNEWEITMNERHYCTPDGFLYRVSLETADHTVAVVGVVAKSQGVNEKFESIVQNDLLLPDEIIHRLIRAICRHLWNSLCEMGGEAIFDRIDLPSFIQSEFGNETRSVLELICRAMRTFQP